MSLPNLNVTEEGQLLNVLFKSTASSDAPLLLFESFVMGMLCACVPLGSYILWIKSISISRAPAISMLWIVLITIVTHWALSLRQFESTLRGSSLGVSVSLQSLRDDIFKTASNHNDTSWAFEAPLYDTLNIYSTYGRAWLFMLPLTAETVLFGFTSFLFALTAYTSYCQLRSNGRSCSSLVIPAMSSVMYMLSLAHWAVSLHYFTEQANVAPADDTFLDDFVTVEIATVTLLSLNAVMSDSIVLWRMCVVWDRARPVFAFGAALLVTTLGLNIANIIAQAGIQASLGVVTFRNDRDSESISVYGQTSIGLAAAFVSLTSNLCATALVALKAWLHSWRLSKHVHSNRRTMVERFMELLVDSGVVYTTIWILYCASFFHTMTSQPVLGAADETYIVTAAGFLDAAMAQITTIYPLIVFILVALDKVHHARGPRALRDNEWPRTRGPAVAVTFDVDIERSTPLSPTSAHPMMAVAGNKHLATALEGAKNQGVSGDK